MENLADKRGDLSVCAPLKYSVAHNPCIRYYLNVILGFGDQATDDIYNGSDSRAARTIPRDVWKVACRKLDRVNAAHGVIDLYTPPGNRLERLKGRLSEFHSIRVNNQFRIVFKWAEGNAREVCIVDYH